MLQRGAQLSTSFQCALFRGNSTQVWRDGQWGGLNPQTEYVAEV